MNFPDKKYNIIYADPPWKYKESWGNGQVGYVTMTNEEIKNMPVKDILDEQAHLYLWVTNPFIKEGLEVCESWGFEYKTLITWVKTYQDGTPEMGMGYYFRGCTEHIIFGVKNKMKCLNKTTRNMVVEVNPKKHSKKPDCFKDMIIKSSGDIPRIELFARIEPDLFSDGTGGWDVWGNES